MSKHQHLKPAGLSINPAYSHVVAASGARTIYISGQIAVDEHGKLVGGSDLAAQTMQVMKNLGLALAAAGANYTDLVKITTFVVNYRPEHRAIIAAARTPFLSKGEPRRARWSASPRLRCRNG